MPCGTTSKSTSRQNSCFLSPPFPLATNLTVYGPCHEITHAYMRPIADNHHCLLSARCVVCADATVHWNVPGQRCQLPCPFMFRITERHASAGMWRTGGVIIGKGCSRSTLTGPFLTGQSVCSHKSLVSVYMGNPRYATERLRSPESTWSSANNQ